MSTSPGDNGPLDKDAAAAWVADQGSDGESDRHASPEAADLKEMQFLSHLPATCRISRREKTKSASLKSKEQKEKKRLYQRAIKEEIRQGSDDILQSVLADVKLDTTDSVKKRLSASRRNKMRDKSRSFERDLKSCEDERSCQSNIRASGSPRRRPSLGLSSGGHPGSPRLAAHASEMRQHSGKGKGHARLAACRQPSVNRQDCQPDRLEFYKNFSLLINLGSKGLKEREEKFKRQKSEEEELLRSRLHDDIWLELQAWHAGRSFRDYEQSLNLQREKAHTILDELKQFCLGEETISSNLSGENTTGSYRDETASLLQLLLDPLRLSDAYVARLYRAMRRVQEQAERFDAVVALFPTTHAMHRFYGSQSAGPDFDVRLNAMQMWLNSATELCTVITTMMKSCGLDKVPIHYPFLSGWWSTGYSLYPPYEGSSGDAAVGRTDAPLQGCPVTVVTSDDSDGAESRKSVRFDVSTPPRSPGSDEEHHLVLPHTSDSKITSHGMTVATSFGAVAIPSFHTGVYRPFIDTMLRKMSLGTLFDKYTKRFFAASVKTFHSIALLESCPTEPSHKAFSRRLSPAGDVVANVPLLPRHMARQLSAVLANEREWSKVICQDDNGGSDTEQTAGVTSTGSSCCAVGAEPGCYYGQYCAMRLVSLKPAYLFLLRMPLDLTHECLRLRLEQRVEPSLLSIRQVTQECQEVLTLAVQVKLMYHHFVWPVLVVLHEAEEKLESYLDDYNADAKEMLGVYFSYLQHWMLELQKQKQATSASMKSILEEGWAYSKHVCPYILGGVVEAGKRFCGMASNLLTSIRDSLDNDVDDAVNEYSDSLFRSSSKVRYPTSDSPSLSSSPSDSEDLCTDVDYRHYLLQTCRGIKNLFRETRERAAKALGFAKMLRKDLEIAADFNVLGSTESLLTELASSNHTMVIVPQKTSYLIFVPKYIVESSSRVLALLNVTCGREDVSADAPVADGDSTRANGQAGEGYLVLVRWNSSTLCTSWGGPMVHVTPSADTAIALSHIDVGGLLLVVDHSSELAARRREFEACVPDQVELVDEQTSCHQAVAESLEELKYTALGLSDAIYSTVELVQDKLFSLDLSSMEDMERSSILTICRETMHQCYNFGFEYLQELTRIVTSSAESRRKLNKNLLRFARMWMQFVTEKCERGRGTRPRWANQGMDFLIIASDPRILMVLDASEFEELKELINRCVSHIIGDKSLASTVGSTPGLTVRSLSSGSSSSPAEPGALRLRTVPRRIISCPIDTSRQPFLRRPAVSDPGTPGSSKGSRDSFGSGVMRLAIEEAGDEFLFPSSEATIRDALSPGAMPTEDNMPIMRVRKAVTALELKRNAKLYDKRFVGRVTERPHDVDYHISVRRVNFKWQRGNKLGEGQYGKVYSAVNVDSGELMAMKELRFQPNDLQTIKEIADELKIFESIQHPSLVKYYGVEVHRDEMFIFMEYCDCGTLEEAAKGGLTEGMIRQYTRKLLVAISVLHEHNIVHRDIKGANIFLLSNGLLKLGDFGCSVQLKDKSTMPGEINSVIGTAAFMAPEVITHRHEGQGRAADIWSLGCVVVEMATGKRPWHELENSYQIMFKVGMGGIPTIPESLSGEGRDFLSHCFTQDPKLRWTSSQLQRHNFTKVDC